MNDAIPRPQAKVRKALTPLLEIRNLTKSFDGQHAVDDVSLTIYKGEIFALLGASAVLLCDIIGRSIRYPFEVPVATVFGVVGTVLFLWLLLRAPAEQ